jgi:hypothetical protein
VLAHAGTVIADAVLKQMRCGHLYARRCVDPKQFLKRKCNSDDKSYRTIIIFAKNSVKLRLDRAIAELISYF